jgi:hypothetical protein
MEKSRKNYNNAAGRQSKAYRELLESKELDAFRNKVGLEEMKILKKRTNFFNPKTQKRYTQNEIEEIVTRRAERRLSYLFETLEKGGNPARQIIRQDPDIVKIYLKSGRQIPPVQGRPDQLVEYRKGLTKGIGRGRERGD